MGENGQTRIASLLPYSLLSISSHCMMGVVWFFMQLLLVWWLGLVAGLIYCRNGHAEWYGTICYTLFSLSMHPVHSTVPLGKMC